MDIDVHAGPVYWGQVASGGLWSSLPDGTDRTLISPDGVFRVAVDDDFIFYASDRFIRYRR